MCFNKLKTNFLFSRSFKTAWILNVFLRFAHSNLCRNPQTFKGVTVWADQLITADPYGWLNVVRNVAAQKRCRSIELRSIRHRDRATLRFTSLFLFVKQKKENREKLWIPYHQLCFHSKLFSRADYLAGLRIRKRTKMYAFFSLRWKK